MCVYGRVALGRNVSVTIVTLTVIHPASPEGVLSGVKFLFKIMSPGLSRLERLPAET